MKQNLKNELPILMVAILPLVYLGAIWSSLPETVPIHWNIHGEIDGIGKRERLLWIPFLLPVLTYLIFLIAPLIDPKRRLKNMGDKLLKLKFAVTFIMSVLAVFILYSSKQEALSPNRITMLLGALFTVLGNFFPTIKPNYFIGIRVPWTLNDDDNWKQTHQFAGKIWIAGGILIIVSSLFIRPDINNMGSFGITLLIAVIPMIYSFRLYRLNKNRTSQ